MELQKQEIKQWLDGFVMKWRGDVYKKPPGDARRDYSPVYPSHWR